MALLDFPLFLGYDETRRRRALTPPNLPVPNRRPMSSAPALPPVPRTMPGAAPPIASPLPETGTPNGLPMRTSGAPGAIPGPASQGSAPPPLPRQDQMQLEKANYLAKAPGRLKSALVGGLRSFGPGLASGGLAGGLGGLAAGALYGGIDPRGLREQQFNEQEKPKIYERWGLEDAETARQTATERAARENMMAEAQIANIGSQIGARNAAQNQLIVIPEGSAAVNSRTGQLKYANPRNQPPPYAAAGPRIFDKRTGQITAESPAKPMNLPDQAGRTANSLQELKQRAEKDWAAWGNIPEGPDKELARQKAAASQSAYNDAVRQLGATYPDYFEVGGFTEPGGNPGWGYYKRRQGTQGAQPTKQQKATAKRGFVDFVAKKLKKTAEEARRLIEADGYGIE
jgi:hypothetical protein